MRAVLDLGWSGLSPAEQTSAIYGGVIGAGFGIWPVATFSGLHLPRRKRRRKGRRR